MYLRCLFGNENDFDMNRRGVHILFQIKKTTPRRRVYALHPELQKRRVREAQIELKERKEEKQITLTKPKKTKKR